MSLLPSRDPATHDAEPRVIGVGSDDAGDVLSALSASTARDILAELHDSPAPPGELADRVGTSLQNAQYHLEKLESAGAVAVVDTAYSEKGREMDVYAPANEPLVICAGDEQDTSGLRSALANFLGGFAVLAFASLLVQQAFGGGIAGLFGPTVRTGSGGSEAPGVSYFVNGSGSSGSGVTETATAVAAEAGGSAQAAASAGVSPGVAFFAGGAVVLLGLLSVWYVRR